MPPIFNFRGIRARAGAEIKAAASLCVPTLKCLQCLRIWERSLAMPPGRRWYFEVREKEIHLIRDGEDMETRCGLKYGAIKDLAVSEGRRQTERSQFILVS